MRFQVTNEISIGLSFVSTPDAPCTLEEFSYCENVQIKIPTCNMVLNYRDLDLSWLQATLYDGAKITCKITSDKSNKIINLNLTIFGTPRISPAKNAEGYRLELITLIDSYKYLADIATSYYYGTISEVLQSVARECNLTSNLIQTSEKQTWYGHYKTYAEFCNYIVDYCYISDTSLPVLAFTNPNTLLLKDVIQELKKVPLYTLEYWQHFNINYLNDSGESDLPANTYLFSDYSVPNVTGLTNANYNYGAVYYQEGLNVADELEYKQVAFTRDTKASEINSPLKSTFKSTRAENLPLNLENTYPEFYTSYCKNQKFRPLFSNVLKIICLDYTEISLLDTVLVSFARRYESSKDATYSGKYIVVGKTITAYKNKYIEQFILINYGRNMTTSELA